MAQWLDAAGLQTSYTRFFADDPLPALDRVDMLIALGGPMSVNDEAALAPGWRFVPMPVLLLNVRVC